MAAFRRFFEGDEPQMDTARHSPSRGGQAATKNQRRLNHGDAEAQRKGMRKGFPDVAGIGRPGRPGRHDSCDVVLGSRLRPGATVGQGRRNMLSGFLEVSSPPWSNVAGIIRRRYSARRGIPATSPRSSFLRASVPQAKRVVKSALGKHGFEGLQYG